MYIVGRYANYMQTSVDLILSKPKADITLSFMLHLILSCLQFLREFIINSNYNCYENNSI